MSKVCQRPKRAYFISTTDAPSDFDKVEDLCQRPKRAYFISTSYIRKLPKYTIQCVNALNGLTSFLRYPLKPLENTGFPASFLQVFVRLF